MPDNTVDYMTRPLELLTVSELTDAVGIKRSAELLGVSQRVVYTIRNTNRVGVERQMALINEIRKDENTCRMRLTITRRAREESRQPA